MKPMSLSFRASLRVLSGALCLFGFVAACSFAIPAYADGTVTLTTSYQGTWRIFIDAASLNDTNCQSVKAETPLESCIDNLIKGTAGDSIAQPWNAEDGFGCADGTNTTSNECNTEFVGESSGAFPVIIDMQCLNGGAPNPTIFGDEGAVVRGWCLVLGVAPPPATTPICANGAAPPPGQSTCASNPEINAGDPDDCQCGGDPINIGTGNMYLEATDYKSEGQFPLVFTRSYNSALANQGPSPDGADQTMGAGWTTNVTGPHLYINTIQQYVTCQDTSTSPATDYVCPASSSPVLVTVWRPDGKQSVFSGLVTSQITGVSGTLAAEPGAVGQLSYGPMPAPLSANQYTANGYTYLRDDGYREFYGDSGLLLMTQAPQGTSLIYSYNSNGQLTTVTNMAMSIGFLAYYVVLEFTYDGNGRIATATNSYQGVNPSTPGSAYTRTYTYDSNGNLSKVQYPDNTVVQYLYENTTYPHALTGIIDENGNRYSTWGYDSSGRAVSSQNGNGTSIANNTSIIYNADGSADVTEPTGLGRHLTFTTVNGKALMSYASEPCPMCADKSQSVSYDSNGYVSSKANFNGYTTLYTHDAMGHELTRIEANGTQDQRTITTVWNAAIGLPESITISNSQGQNILKTSYCYNFSNSSCIDSQNSGLVWTKTETDLVNNISRTTTYTYTNGSNSPSGLLSKIVGPRTDLVQSISFSYNPISTGSSSISFGAPPTGISMLGFGFNRDMNGLPRNVHDGNADSIGTPVDGKAYTYDARQRVLTETASNSLNPTFPVANTCSPTYVLQNSPCANSQEVTQYQYDSAGELIKLTKPAGDYLQYGYDTAHRLTSIKDSTGEKIVYTLDALGNRTLEQVYAFNGSITYSHRRIYDNFNHLYQDIGGNGQTTTYTYDLDGNITKIVDPLNHSSTKTYDALDRLQSVIDNAGGTTTYNVDALGHVTDVTDPRYLNTHYVYDAFGDILQLQSPDTGTTTYTYDLAGNRISQVDAKGNIANYTYDFVNRLTSIKYPQNSNLNITYTYDLGYCGTLHTNPDQNGAGFGNGPGNATITGGVGHLICMQDETGTTAYSAYDGYGNLLLEKRVSGSPPLESLVYTYDFDNQLSGLELGFNDHIQPSAVGYKRDYLDRISEVDSINWNSTSGTFQASPVATGVLYEPFGPEEELTLGNGIFEQRTFDSSYRVTNIYTPSNPGIMDWGFGYDSNDNVVSINDSWGIDGQSFTRGFSYDSLGRLQSVRGTYDFNYGYDADGNRIQRTNVDSGVTVNYTMWSASNILRSQSNGFTYTHDADGNITSDGTYTYNYGADGRLGSVTSVSTGATVATYLYDGLGRRAEKTVGTTSTFFVYDHVGHLLAELGATGQSLRTHVWMGDRPVAFYPNGPLSTSPQYVLTDNLGSPRIMTNSGAAQSWFWESDPFGRGNATPMVGNTGSYNLRQPGQYYDAETTLYYNMNRDYDPASARYWESDPIGLAGGINTYTYVMNDPLRYIDPFGLCNQQSTGNDPNSKLTDEQKHAACINNFLNNTFGHGTADDVREHSFIGPDGTDVRNEIAGESTEGAAAETYVKHGLMLEVPILGEALLAHDAYVFLTDLRASFRYHMADTQCIP